MKDWGIDWSGTASDVGSSFTSPSFDAGSVLGSDYNFTPDFGGKDWGIDWTGNSDGMLEDFQWGAENYNSGGGYQPQWGKWAQAADIASKHLDGQESSGKHKPGYPAVGKAGGTQVSSLDGKHSTIQTIHPTATVIPGGPGGSRGPGAMDYVKTGLQVASLFCDIRLKTDIAPLESTEVNDALADVAFFVKEIRECA